MPNKTPVAPAVREMLERIVSSRAFSRSERSRNLLRHLVEREQAGQAEHLKGFSIGVDVFGKDADFDPTTDAVVRVQAGRLRELLAQYYADEGAEDILRIAIPRGGYVPVYEWLGRVPQLEPEMPEPNVAASPPLQPPARGKPNRQLALLWSAVAILAVAVCVLIYRQSDERASAGQPVEGGEMDTGSIVSGSENALPTVAVVADGAEGAVASFGATLRLALSAFETIDLIESVSAPGGSQFAFVVTPAHGGEGIVTYLQDRVTGRVLLSRQFDAGEIDGMHMHDSVADLLSSVVPASGILYASIERDGRQKGPAECLLLYEKFFQEAVNAKHTAAYRCFDELIRIGRQPAIVYAQMSSLQVQGIVDGYPMPAEVSMDTARALAWRAIRGDPTSAAAHRAYGYLQSLGDSPAEAVPWMRKAHELNTYDLGMAAAYAYSLVAAGYYREGEVIMQRAVTAASAHSTWWDYTLFVAAFMSGDNDTAYRASQALATPGRPHYLAARLIAANLKGKVQLAVSLREQFLTEFPALAANPAMIFKPRHPAAEIVDRLVAALALAGIAGEAG